jgi:dTDP-4-dehydrorhamnose reductase
MKLLVTGGSGLMGSKVAELGLQEGYEVFSGYAHHRPTHGVAVKIDLRDDSSVGEAVKAVRPDVIIHTAGLTDVDLCETDKNLAYRINAQATKTLAEAAKVVGAFTVYTSTDYVFDGSKGMYKEEDATDPVNYYGYSKLLGEIYCDAIARTCVIYGSRPASGKVNFALWILKGLAEGKAVKVVIDQHITPTLNTNLAGMVLELAERRHKGVYHLAGATRISRYDFAVMIARTFGFDENMIIRSRMSEMTWAAKRPADSSLDISKATRCLNAKPWSIEEALRTLRDRKSTRLNSSHH